jgi:hypothetical protein
MDLGRKSELNLSEAVLLPHLGPRRAKYRINNEPYIEAQLANQHQRNQHPTNQKQYCCLMWGLDEPIRINTGYCGKSEPNPSEAVLRLKWDPN